MPDVLGIYRWHKSNASRDYVQMLKREYQALVLFVTEYPDALTLLGRITVARRLSSQAYGVAYKYRSIGNMLDAIRWLRVAIKENPVDMKNYVRLLKYSAMHCGSLGHTKR